MYVWLAVQNAVDVAVAFAFAADRAASFCVTRACATATAPSPEPLLHAVTPTITAATVASARTTPWGRLIGSRPRGPHREVCSPFSGDPEKHVVTTHLPITRTARRGQ